MVEKVRRVWRAARMEGDGIFAVVTVVLSPIHENESLTRVNLNSIANLGWQQKDYENKPDIGHGYRIATPELAICVRYQPSPSQHIENPQFPHK